MRNGNGSKDCMEGGKTWAIWFVASLVCLSALWFGAGSRTTAGVSASWAADDTATAHEVTTAEFEALRVRVTEAERKLQGYRRAIRQNRRRIYKLERRLRGFSYLGTFRAVAYCWQEGAIGGGKTTASG